MLMVCESINERRDGMNKTGCFYIGKPDYYRGVAMADDLIELRQVSKAVIFHGRTAIYMAYSSNQQIVDALLKLQGAAVTVIEMYQGKKSFANYSGCLEAVNVYDRMNLIELSIR